MKYWDPMDIAWIAGIIEGEGCIYINKVRLGKGSLIRVSVRMTDYDTIQSLYDKTGIGRITGPTQHGRKKPTWDWKVNRLKDVVRLLLAIYPLMHERRRAKITEAVEFMTNRRREVDCKRCNKYFTTFHPIQEFCCSVCKSRYTAQISNERKKSYAVS